MLQVVTVLVGLGLPSCLLRAREQLPGKLPILARVSGRAQQCLQVPRLSRGQMSACMTRQFPELGVPVTHRSSPARGCRGNAPQLRASPSLLQLYIPVVVCGLHQPGPVQGSPHPFPADSPSPGGCPVAVPGLCLAGSDSQGKLCLSSEGAKELPSGGVSSEVTSPGLFPSG